jgi:hypothetical protein
MTLHLIFTLTLLSVAHSVNMVFKVLKMDEHRNVLLNFLYITAMCLRQYAFYT